jgi:hypothetical protein
MAQQTAVEWLQEVYNQQGNISPVQFEQAKEMEEQKTIDALVAGQNRALKIAYRKVVRNSKVP